MKLNTPGFVGEKLREAREARGFNASELADLLEISRQSISKYENDLQSPSPQVMDKICQILMLPSDFFLHARKRKIDNESPIFYRSMSAATKTERLRAQGRYLWLQDIFSYLWKFIEFPSVNLPTFDDVPKDPTLISNEIIEDIAVRTRRYWNLGDGPISSMVWLLENNGIIVGSYNLETATLDAFSQVLFNRPHIILGIDKKSAVRSRFNAAHELGHLILHQGIPKKLLNSPQYFKMIEDQAHRFAGAFHLTESAFIEEVSSVSLEQFRLLKPRWKVSIAAMLHRAKDLGFVEEEEAHLLWRNYNRRGWKKLEPLDDEIPQEQPQLLKNAFELIINNNIQSRSEILQKLKLNPSDIEEIAGLPQHYLSNEVIEMPIRRRSHFSECYDQPAEVINLFGEK